MARRHLESQRAATDALVHLYDIDVTRYGGGILRWTPGPLNSQSGNLLSNPCCLRNTTGWAFSGSTSGSPTHSGIASGAGPEWVLSGFGSGYLRRSTGLAVGEYMDAYCLAQPVAGLPAGALLEVQARVQPHRCRASLIVAFLDEADAEISSVDSAALGREASNSGAPSRADRVDDYTLLWLQPVVPAGTVKVAVTLRATPIGSSTSTNPHLFFTMVQPAFVSMATRAPLPFMPSSVAGQVSFGGDVYRPVPIMLEGARWTGQGAIPRPRVTIPNVDNFARQVMANFNDLRHCTVTRRRVYRHALDGMPYADPTDYYGPDIWQIDRYTEKTRELVTFELVAPMDIQGKGIPGRTVIRDICTHSYRSWSSSVGFVQGTCPYAGASYFKADGTPTGSPAEDQCSFQINNGCSLRFPRPTPLPSRAFPGITKRRM